MTHWINSISQLQYYIPNSPICYCESLIYPDDMLLQALINNGNGTYAVTFYVYSADGLTQYEDATAYFEYYFAVMNGSNQQFMNARLKSFSPAMCLHKCFIIRAVITQQSGTVTLFDKYTERWCVPNCCDTARGVTFSQDGLTSTTTTPTIEETVPASSDFPISNCGYPLIRLISTFDCIDQFTNTFYGIPETTLSGSATFGYVAVSTFEGRIVQRPTEITREISYNCDLQRTEASTNYFFEGLQGFPAWKMNVIENQLKGNHIYVDDFYSYEEYQFYGGVTFKKAEGARDCDEIFKLEANLNSCIVRQTFGCADPCANITNYFIVPASYAETGFYNANGDLIANVYSGDDASPYDGSNLLDWLRNQDGVTGVTDISVIGLDCDIYALAAVSGYGNIPTSLYFDSPIARNRMFALPLASVTDICGYAGDISCASPVIGNTVVYEFACDAPVFGDIIVTDATTTPLTISDYNNWVQSSSSASLYKGAVTFSIDTDNTTIIAGIGDEYTLAGDVIGYISVDGRPSLALSLTSETNGSIPAGVNMIINTDGTIQIFGTFTIAVTNELTLTFTDIVYNV